MKFLAYSTNAQDIESRVLKVVSGYDKITAAKVSYIDFLLFPGSFSHCLVNCHARVLAHEGLTFHPGSRLRLAGSCRGDYGHRG